MNNKQHPDFDTIREDFNIYEIENGQILRAKQFITDIIVQSGEGNKQTVNLVMKQVSFVITNVEIDTTNLEVSAPDKITVKDQVRELKFKRIKEVINIYETEKALVFLTSRVQKVFLTNKKDDTGAPILRYETLTGFNTLSKDTLEIQERISGPILTTSQLNIFSERFLCELCKQTNHIMERTCRRREVYDGLKIGAFEENAIPQVMDEIVQDLILKELITFGNNREEIRLTSKGLHKCKDYQG